MDRIPVSGGGSQVMVRCLRSSLVGATTLLIVVLPFDAHGQIPDSARIVAGADRVIAPLTALAAAAPGCTVGIARDGRPVYLRAFGMADLELGVPLTPQSILESGSVAKQFTAAAIVLLALDGKLGLDDPVRKYIPELPDYGALLTIRHLLNHTGGVRDWGSVMSLTGVGRGDRVISQALAMDVITHQQGLDFTPGTEYSYSNSGYTLASTIVERVSKQSLPEFTAERFFKPLGMTHSSWRDDYQRLVSGRAQAYAPDSTTWQLLMPFMNVYGNGGMLTTVGDWLKWNAMLDSHSLGGALVDSLETFGVLNDGRKIAYALGLTVNRYKGQRHISHGGSTAGYQTYLGRFPDLKLSVAVMCNATSRNATGFALSIVDSIVGPLPPSPRPETITLGADALLRYASLWRNEKTHLPLRTTVVQDTLRVAGGPVLRPLRDGSFLAGASPARFEHGASGKPARLAITRGENVERYLAVREWTPTAAELNSFAGVWYSDEAQASFTFAVDAGQGALVQRPTTRLALRPLYRDHFEVGDGPGDVIWFTRNAAGAITTMHYGTSRMRDMPFTRKSR